MSDDPLTDKEMVYDNFSAPIPDVGETISVEGQFHKVKDRLFVYMSNLDVDLQIILRCELIDTTPKRQGGNIGSYRY